MRRVGRRGASPAHIRLARQCPRTRQRDAARARALDGAVIEPGHLHFGAEAPGCGAAPPQLSTALASAERELILEALREGGSRRDAAGKLGISPRTLRHKLARLRASGVDLAACP